MSTKQKEENSGYRKKQTNLLVGRRRKSKKLHEHPNSQQLTSKWEYKSKTTREINWRIQMLQPQQSQHTRYNPSGYYFRIINGKELHNTIGRHQHNKHYGKRHNGKTWTTSINVGPTKTR